MELKNSKFIKNLIETKKVDDLIYLYAKGNRTEFYFTSADELITQSVKSRNIGYYEKLLHRVRRNFYRVHPSYLVNLQKISTINEDFYWAKAHNGEVTIPIQNVKVDEIKEIANKYEISISN